MKELIFETEKMADDLRSLFGESSHLKGKRNIRNSHFFRIVEN
jgi:hypothetical protein